MTPLWARDVIEKVVAKACLWLLLMSFLASLFIDDVVSSRALTGLVAVVALLLLLSWLFLLGSNLHRFLFDRKSDYKIWHILVVLFIPVLGAIFVSLQKTNG